MNQNQNNWQGCGRSVLYLVASLFAAYILMKISFKMIGIAFSIFKGVLTFSFYFILVLALFLFISYNRRKR